MAGAEVVRRVGKVRRENAALSRLALLVALVFCASGSLVSASVDGAVSGPRPATTGDATRLNPNPLLLNAPDQDSDASHWVTDVTAHPRPNQLWDPSPELFLLQADYSGYAYKLKSELGDFDISGTPYTAQDLSRRGAHLGVQTLTGPTATKLETFAGTSVSATGTNGVLVGAAGELSLFSDYARFRTVFLSGSEFLDAARPLGQRRGQSLGFLASLQPIKGKLGAEAELAFSQVNPNTATSPQPCSDAAYRFKLGGELSNYRYGALYTHTGPQYQLVSGEGPKPDNEGVALSMGATFQVHALDLNLSRYNNNTADNDRVATLYRYEGVLDYSFKGIKELPLGVQYRKSLLSSAHDPEGATPTDTDSDTVTGRANYLLKRWDLGLTWSYLQRTDRIKDALQLTSNTVSFSPKYRTGSFSVAPDVSVSRSRDLVGAVNKQSYAVNLDLKGKVLRRFLGYEMKSGYSRDVASVPSAASESFGTRVKLGCDLTKIMKKPLISSIGVKGEYNRTIPGDSSPGRNDYTVLFVLDSGRNLF